MITRLCVVAGTVKLVSGLFIDFHGLSLKKMYIKFKIKLFCVLFIIAFIDKYVMHNITCIWKNLHRFKETFPVPNLGNSKPTVLLQISLPLA